MGGTYGKKPLGSFFEGIKGWLFSISERKRKSFTLTYVGSDAQAVSAACERVGLAEKCSRVEIRGYVPIGELAAVCRGAFANAYIWEPTTFHKKLPELLACGRPVIAYPGERDESVDLARQVGGKLFVCRSHADMRAALDATASDEFRGRLFGDKEKLRLLGWDVQAGALERCLTRAPAGCQSVGLSFG